MLEPQHPARDQYSTFIRDINERQKLWRLSDTLTCHDYKIDKDLPYNHVVTSVALPLVRQSQGRDECYIFPADADGKILWVELPGSQKQPTDHVLVITEMGYPPMPV